MSSYGSFLAAPSGIAAEIEVSPDNKFIIASNRNDLTFRIPSPTPINQTTEPSDSLAVFELMNKGTLSFVQLDPAGGSWPRHFKLNMKGDSVAMSLQTTTCVAIMKRI
ncbi:3-carboxymuconate cyclase [Colletotrichum costaricense]|uniref:3-carboxymuconate cyclase n=1 Tax=Colletotrichum costaricense TaxID=1209916 RepID=A0AAI9Z2I2_9PEZI|nr:3-carboxymuconate cyclase [Colletotrichum costaricense]KAK1532300.1 3-carboxymuconate cyclase [Colletotrichum costaricense]